MPVTYLPPTVPSTTRRTTRLTTTTLKPSRKTFTEKEGYDYPAPNIPFTLPPKEKILIKQEVPVTYLPPVETTRRTTRRTTTTTPRTTVPQFKIVVPEQGYDYPKLRSPLEKISIKADPAPTIPSTYLPPETTTRVITTPRTTTTRKTTPIPPRERKIEVKEGYDYPKPRIAFPPPSEKTFVKEDSVPVTYLPPVADPPVTQRVITTTTRRPTTTR